MKRAELSKRAQKDKFGIGKHGFQSGNPASGILPTIPGAEWFDHVQEELCNVIEGTGTEINPNKNNQLIEGIKSLIAFGSLSMRGALGSKNLNDLKGEAHYGVYYQSGNAAATSERNYPINQAGALLVLASAYHGIQVYLPHGRAVTYVRPTDNAGSWGDWSVVGDLVNNLNSDRTDAALTAAQGKALAERIEQAVPSGTIVYIGGTTAPAGWLKLNGAVISVAAYQALVDRAWVGIADNDTADYFYRCTNQDSPHTSRSATGQYFVLADARAEVIRGWDDGRGVDGGRKLGTWQKGSGHTIDAGATSVVVSDYSNSTTGVLGLMDAGYDTANPADYPQLHVNTTYKSAQYRVQTTNDLAFGAMRMRNLAALPIIKI